MELLQPYTNSSTPRDDDGWRYDYEMTTDTPYLPFMEELLSVFWE